MFHYNSPTTIACKGKKPATQQTLQENPSPLDKANSQGLKELERQEVTKTPAKNRMEHPDEMQTKVQSEPAKFDKSFIRDPTRNPAGGPVRSSVKDPAGGAQLQFQQNIDTIKVNVPEILDSHIVEVNADLTLANKANDLLDSDSDSEMRVCVAYLKKKRKKAKLKAKFEQLEQEIAAGFLDKHH